MKTNLNFDKIALAKEVTFKMSRSAGSGGQHVNKVATKATLFYNLKETNLFGEEELKERLLSRLKGKLTKEGVLIIQSQKSRSALKNKQDALKRLYFLLQETARPIKKRKFSRTSAAVHRKRLDDKKRQGFKKSLRQKVDRFNSIDLF